MRSPRGRWLGLAATMGNTRSRLTGVLRLVQWAAIIALITLVVDLLYVFWPYPGKPRGVETLELNLQQEWQLLISLSDEHFAPLAYRIHGTLYQGAFVVTGIDPLVAGASDSTQGDGLNKLGQEFIRSTLEVWQTCAVGLQLFACRLAVLAMAIPLFLLAAIGAVSDGLVTWYLRRTGGGRESAFIYHRAKRLSAISVLGLCFVYLVPPIPLDPRWILPPFVFAYAAGIRVATAYFKKYL